MSSNTNNVRDRKKNNIRLDEKFPKTTSEARIHRRLGSRGDNPARSSAVLYNDQESEIDYSY